jgi:hypothetical protein
MKQRVVASRQGDEAVAQWRQLIAREAWRAWKMLPPQTRGWLDVDDMIQEGVVFARLHIWPRVKADRGQFQTLLVKSLRNYFYGHFVAVYTKNERHCEAKTSSLEGTVEFFHKYGLSHSRVMDVDQLLKIDRSMLPEPTDLIACDEATVAFVKLYDAASATLKVQLARWFLTPNMKCSTCGVKFQQLRVEFITLAKLYRLGISDCRAILRSPISLDVIARHITWLPYDANNPAPAGAYMSRIPVRNGAGFGS